MKLATLHLRLQGASTKCFISVSLCLEILLTDLHKTTWKLLMKTIWNIIIVITDCQHNRQFYSLFLTIYYLHTWLQELQKETVSIMTLLSCLMRHQTSIILNRDFMKWNWNFRKVAFLAEEVEQWCHFKFLLILAKQGFWSVKYTSNI